jgi:DNA-binding LacI/PurR family transcriptional regulator
VPKAVRIAVLVNPTNASSAEATLRDIPEAARALGLQIQVLNASTSREIEAAFATLVRDRADALFVAPTGSSSAGASNLQRSRCAMGFQRPIPLAMMSKSVG